MDNATCLTCQTAPVIRAANGRRLKFCSAECRQQRARRLREEARRAAVAADSKTCTRCDRDLPKTEFHADKKRLDGLYPWCVDCRRGYHGSTRRPGPAWESKADYDRARRAVLNAAPDRQDRWFRTYLWTTFRMTPESYQDLLDKQDGRCAICRSNDPGKSRGREVGRFHVDHDHSCCPGRRSCGRCIRGLLCRGCNTGIGCLRDDPDRLLAAADYVKRGRTSVRVA